MSKLTDEKLIKSASHAGRNLAVLALLASIIAAVCVGLAVYTADTISQLAAVAGLTLAVIATGYWLLAVAAKRGNPSAVGTVLVVLVLQLAFFLVSAGLQAVKDGANAQVIMPRLAIPILIIVALASSRDVLLELRKRGLWNEVFASAKPSARLCLLGSSLVVVGFLGLNGGTVYAGRLAAQSRQQELQHAQSFLAMVQTEEAAFLEAMGAFSRSYTHDDIQIALARATELELKAKSLEATANGPLCTIVNTYCGAVRQWKQAIALLEEDEPDLVRAEKMLLLGDKLRTQAGQDFDHLYARKQ